MPIWIRSVHVLGEGKFKTSIVEALLKFLELIRWSHLSHTKYIRINLFNDPNQCILFALRLGRKLGSCALSPVHLEIVLDVIVSEFYRLLSKSALGEQDERQYQSFPGEHTNGPARQKLARHPRFASPQSCANRLARILESNPRKAETAVGCAAASQRLELGRLAPPEPVAPVEFVEPAVLVDKVEYFAVQLSDLARPGGVLCQTPHGPS